MTDAIERFFSAWQLEDATARHTTISQAVTSAVQYDDPRTPATVNGIEALVEYVGMFSANAPGWKASVVKSDTTAGVTRVTVAFGGMGPDGKEMTQLGQYFAEFEDDLVARMVGFVGTGEA